MSDLPRANKALGQHFLTSTKVIESITGDFKGRYNSFIEVGPGPAVLTKTLATMDVPGVAVEKDNRFKDLLTDLLGEENVVMMDALETDWNELIRERNLPSPVWMVSNLPYNVSVPLTLSFVKTPIIKVMTLMVQKEVGEKMFPEMAGKFIQKARGSLGCICNTYFRIKKLCPVPPGAFTPPPRVDSVVLSFERLDNPVIPLGEWEEYESFLRLLYKTRRKQAAKVLSEKYERQTVEKLLESLGLPATARAETFNLDQVHILYSTLVKGESHV